MKAWLALLICVVLVGLLITLGVLVYPNGAHSQVASITLDWTAPGDDGVVGTASLYEMRYSTTRPDTTSVGSMDAWFANATNVSAMPIPLIAGTAQSKTVTGPFTSGQTYYFVIRACDEVPNCSPYSNVAAKFLPDAIPPARILNLFAR